MLKLVTKKQLDSLPKLKSSMFKDRAVQFKQRLGWHVYVDGRGHEKDEYDNEYAHYVVYLNRDGSHGGSMRLHRTDQCSMANDHFRAALPWPLRFSKVWETTRFCLSPKKHESGVNIASAVMLGAFEFGLINDLDYGLGIFNRHMRVIYQVNGWRPIEIGQMTIDGLPCFAGLWEFDLLFRQKLRAKAKLPPKAIDYATFDLQHIYGSNYDVA